jgi:PTH1 family peptidyl-tRNA hydrolase
MLTLYCLGNPTLKHKQNRHNAGLLLGDYLVKKLNLNLKKFKHFKLSNTFQIDGTQCQIALSENYMNESGNGVLSLKTTKLSKSDELFVLYDELDLSLGEIKIKYSGGNAGHNGLRSISSKIGDNYWKLRIGVDHPGDKEQVTRHVLGNFKENEKKILNNLFELIYLNLSQIFISRHLSNLGI